MKKINIIYALILCTAFVMTGCKDNVEQETVQPLKVTGTFAIKGDAFPSVVTKNYSARSASFACVDNLEDYNVTATATHKLGGYKITGTVKNVHDETDDVDYCFYNFSIPATGEWKIQISATKEVPGSNDAVFYGESSIRVLSGATPTGAHVLYLDGEDSLPRIYLMPVVKEGDKGTINLVVKNYLVSGTIEDTRNYTVVWTWQDGYKPENITDLDTTVTMSYRNNSTSNPFYFEDVEAGAYLVKIEFFDAENVLLYSCDEWIHVFGGMTTDTWYGSGPHYSYDGDDNYLVLTQTAVNSFLATPEVTSKGRVVLYKTNVSGSYDIMITDQDELDNLSTFTAIDTTEINMPDGYHFTGFNNVFCYGPDGTIYITAESIDTYNENVKTHAIVEFPVDDDPIVYTFSDEQDDTEDKEPTYITALYYDSMQGILFAMVRGDTPLANGTHFPMLYPLVLSGDEAVFNPSAYPALFQIPGDVNAFAVVSDYLYIPYFQDGYIKLNCYKLTQETNPTRIGFRLESTIPLIQLTTNTYHVNKTAYVDMTDMIYLNDCLYILFNDCNFTSKTLSSRGGVLKYNLFTKDASIVNGCATVDVFEDESVVNTYLLSSKATDMQPLYSDNNEENLLYFNWNGTVYCPDENAGSEFYGPQKFISYSKSELTIADSGYKYTLDTNAAVRFENINRIVKFGLSDFEINTCTDVSSQSIMFISDKDKLIEPDEDNYGVSAYINNAGEFEPYLNPSGTGIIARHYILKKD